MLVGKPGFGVGACLRAASRTAQGSRRFATAQAIPLHVTSPYYRYYSSSVALFHDHRLHERDAGACAPEDGAAGGKGSASSSSSEHHCWACGACVNSFNLFCGKCEYIQPLQKDAVNYFQLLKVPQSFDLDVAALDANFKSTQRAIHPDLFGTKTKREQDLSADASSAVNAAYKVLRSPSTRAQYLLQLHGIDAIGEASGTSFTDPELLMEVMEQRETLEDPAATRETIAALERSTVKNIKQTIEQLSSAFKSNDLEGAAKLTVALQYHTKLKNECDEWYETDAQNAAAARAANRATKQQQQQQKEDQQQQQHQHVHGPGCGHDHDQHKH